jgi:hypothetical protein
MLGIFMSFFIIYYLRVFVTYTLGAAKYQDCNNDVNALSMISYFCNCNANTRVVYNR